MAGGGSFLNITVSVMAFETCMGSCPVGDRSRVAIINCVPNTCLISDPLSVVS